MYTVVIGWVPQCVDSVMGRYKHMARLEDPRMGSLGLFQDYYVKSFNFLIVP